MTRRRPARSGTALVILILVLGGLTVTACSRSDEPGKEALTEEIDAIVVALEVPDDRVAMQGYAVDRDPSAERCADVDDPWVADRSAIVAPDVVAQDTVVATLSDRYRDLDARLRLFRTTTGSDHVVFLALDTERRIAVQVDVTRDGRTSIAVRHSSCPVDDYEQEPNGPYEEIDLPS